MSQMFGKNSILRNNPDGVADVRQVDPADMSVLMSFFERMELPTSWWPYETERLQKRLKELAEKYDIPSAKAALNPTYDALKNCVKNDCRIPKCFINEKLFARDMKDIYAYTVDGKRKVPYSICTYAAINGDLAVLKAVRAAGAHWDENTTQMAAKYDHFEILKWLFENGCPKSPGVTRQCYINGNNDMLEYAIKNGCPWYMDLTGNVANDDNLEYLKYIRNLGCPWYEGTISIIIQENNLEMFRYALANGCQFPGRVDCYSFIFSPEMRECADEYYLRQLEKEMNTQACIVATKTGLFKSLTYAIEHGCKYELRELRRIAIERGHNAIIKYLRTL